MKPLKILLVAGLLTAGAVVCWWLYKRENESSTSRSAYIENHSPRTSAQTHHDNLPLSEDREFVNPHASSKELQVAYRTLARLTSLPDGTVDTSGRTLPKGFLSYLQSENTGYEQFLARLSREGAAAFNSLKQTSRAVGVIEFVELVATISPDDKPSSFDFIVYSSLKDQIREYPAHINGIAQTQVARQWSLLSQSPNPVFRLLAIEEANRVIKDKAAALALLDARTSEVDPVIVQALIDQLVAIGGDDAKTPLRRISDNALARRDHAILKAANDAMAKSRAGADACGAAGGAGEGV